MLPLQFQNEQMERSCFQSVWWWTRVVVLLFSYPPPQRHLSSPQHHPSTHHSLLTDTARWWDRNLLRSRAIAQCIHNYITQHGYGKPYSSCSQKHMVISERSAHSCVSGKCMAIVGRSLTCRCSTGLSHSSCSSLTSMSEGSWSRNTHRLQCLVHVFSYVFSRSCSKQEWVVLHLSDILIHLIFSYYILYLFYLTWYCNLTTATSVYLLHVCPSCCSEVSPSSPIKSLFVEFFLIQILYYAFILWYYVYYYGPNHHYVKFLVFANTNLQLTTSVSEKAIPIKQYALKRVQHKNYTTKNKVLS